MQNPESTINAIARILNPLKLATFQRRIIMLTATKRAIVTGNPIPKNHLTGGEKRLNRNSIVSTVIRNPGIIMKYFLKASNINVRQIHDTRIEVSAKSDQERLL